MADKPTPTNGLIDYINHIKPYHTKILETNIELVCNDLVSVTLTDTNNNFGGDMSINYSTTSIVEHIIFIHG